MVRFSDEFEAVNISGASAEITILIEKRKPPQMIQCL